MTVEIGFWRVDGKAVAIAPQGMTREERLEDLLAADIAMVSPQLMVIGRQVNALGKRIDLLAIDADGQLAVIELKRDQTPREVVAQVLEYGAWVRTLRNDEIAAIWVHYRQHYFNESSPTTFDDAFRERFGVELVPEDINDDHQLIVVATSLDAATERVVTYLHEHHEVEINAVFFRFYQDGDRDYLVRAWLNDPTVESTAVVDHQKGTWNGEYYANFSGTLRSWEEARKYGFISAGGGAWYSSKLDMLQPGDRVWVKTSAGYVGVGRVLEARRPIDDFKVTDERGIAVPIGGLGLKISGSTTAATDPERAEYLVRIGWDKTVPEAEAKREVGLFGNQNSVARPKTPKWNHTIERLKVLFGVR
jgi:hypothetical protein